MRRALRNHGLSLAAFGLFLVSLLGQIVPGRAAYNQEQRDHGQRTVGVAEYVATGHSVEAVFENWESEFLQLATFVFLTAFLVQKGSADSRKPREEKEAGETEPTDEDPRRHAGDADAPWPVRRGGWVLKVYENSLSIALFLLFLGAFWLHAAGGAAELSEERAAHGGPPVTTLQYMGEARFWFESFQNWQSEFLAVWTLAVLSIYLRQRGSPQSKPVHAPHAQTAGG